MKSKSVDGDTLNGLTVTIRCANCGAPIKWSLDDLQYAKKRIDWGDHAAPACDDDCAVLVEAWDPNKLQKYIKEMLCDSAGIHR
jgi:hypothetical protein